jgi:cytochrome c oxidase assembly factor CtaG
MTQAFLFDACCWIGGTVTAAAYAIGWARLSAKGVTHHRPSVVLFAAAWCCALLPVLSPVHRLGHSVFWLHMVEHEMLILIAAPLFVLARPGPIFLWALPPQGRAAVQNWLVAPTTRAIWEWLTRPTVAVILHGATLWLWHEPRLFEAALDNATAHLGQHFSFFIPALLFWWSLLSRRRRSGNPMPAALALFATALQTSLLGLLLTISSTLWYPFAADPFPICGLSRLEDQQVAGLIMWIPGTAVYLAAALWLLGHRLTLREQRYAPPYR